MVKVAPGLEPVLRRPFSLHRMDQDAGGIVEIIYQVVGKGTDILTERRSGEELEVLGPPLATDSAGRKKSASAWWVAAWE